MNSLFAGSVTRRFAITFVGLFSPIYIYGLLLDEFNSSFAAILGVFVFYIFLYVVKLFFHFYSEDLSRKIGYKGTIRKSVMPYLLFIPFMLLASQNVYFLVLASFFYGAHMGFYWWGFHGYFSMTADKHHFGKNIGKYEFYDALAKIAAPLIGAIIIVKLGFNVIYISSALLMILSAIFFGKNNDKRQKLDVKAVDVFKRLVAYKSLSLALVGISGSFVIIGVVWPLYLFLFFDEVIGLGLVVSAGLFVTAVFSLILGNLIDKHKERTSVLVGSPVSIMSWILRVFLAGANIFVFADFLSNMGLRMLDLPILELIYKEARSGKSALVLLYREGAITLGLIISLVLSTIAYYFTKDLRSTFILAAILSTLPLIAIYRKRI